MNDDELWAAIDEQRASIADLLEQLSEDEWSTPSLCAGWTVRDVAAHLTLQQLGPGALLLSMVRHPGGINRVIRESARTQSKLPTSELVARIRATLGSRKHNFGVTKLETLSDVLVHGQDIALPLHRDLAMPSAGAVVAADRIWGYSGAKAKVFDQVSLAGLRLVATDCSWSRGDGDEIRGPMAMILLLLTGRTAALPHLTGPGAEALRMRMPA